MFPFITDVDPDGKITSDLNTDNIKILKEKMKTFFPSLLVDIYDFVRNPFAVTSNVTFHQYFTEQEQLLELQSDRSLKLK